MRQNSTGMELSPVTRNQDITSKAMTPLDSRISLVSAQGAKREPRCDEGIQVMFSCEELGIYISPFEKVKKLDYE